MIVVYVNESAPGGYAQSIFLAGPTPRAADVPSWRPEALALLERLGYQGVVFVPESRDGVSRAEYDQQVEWEERHLHLADQIVFWLPREMRTMPALTTNDEWGAWKRSGKCVFGAPPEAERVRYQREAAEKLRVPVAESLEETLRLALERMGEGAWREAGEREIPLDLWRAPSFQRWYQTLREAGNTLEGARVEWVFRVGRERNIIFCWAVHARVFVTREGRVKANEIVIARPDIATVLLYRKGARLEETEVVLIREFRSPGRFADGFVRELPGGSTFKPIADYREVAAAEVSEEVGFEIPVDRLVRHHPRQAAATFSAHQVHLFSAELSEEEMEVLRASGEQPRGVTVDAYDQEITYTEVWTVGDLLREPRVDWSTLGFLFAVLGEVGERR